MVYSFGVLEHVRDVDWAVSAALKMLRPGGRYCAVVPMNEFRATRKACGREWRPGRYPDAIEPVEFGAFFVAVSKA